MRRHTALVGGIALAVLAGLRAQAPPPAEWPVYGGSNASDRYSPLAEITTANVDRLVEAWRFDTGETGGFQVNPIVVDGVVYSPTPRHTVVALDAATGALQLDVRPELESRGPNRGVTYWQQRRRAPAVRGRRPVPLRPRRRRPACRSPASATRAASTCAATSAAIRRRSRSA